MILVTNLKSVSESYTATRWAKQNIIKCPHTETTDGAMQRAKRETHSDQGSDKRTKQNQRRNSKVYHRSRASVWVLIFVCFIIIPH